MGDVPFDEEELKHDQSGRLTFPLLLCRIRKRAHTRARAYTHMLQGWKENDFNSGVIAV